MSEDNSPEIKSVVIAQEPPKQNDNTPIWDLVIADIKERDDNGLKKYGVRLQSFNGRNSLIDAYQEVLDLTVYFRQAIEERNVMVDFLKRMAKANPSNEDKMNELSYEAYGLLRDLGEK